MIKYDGSRYFGWQKQDNVPTVQAEVETALAKVADHEVIVHCSGRTDRCVHALGQVIHFDTQSCRETKAWILGTNSFLPDDIRVYFAKEVTDDFHARFSAILRHYRYTIYNQQIAPVFIRKFATLHKYHLDAELMHEAARVLLGELDFSAFRGSGCQSLSTMRNVTLLNVERKENIVTIDIQANAFLLHMVRNIVGSLLEVGDGRRPAVWIKEVLLSRDRKRAGVTALPQGLALVKTIYPEKFGLNLQVSDPHC